MRPRCHCAPSHPSVLIVEDNMPLASILRTLVRSRGWRVYTAHTVEQAIMRLEDDLPTTILLDLNLPDGEGVRVLQYVRQRGLPVRVAVASACEDPGTLGRARQWSPDAIWSKPVCLRSLTEFLGSPSRAVAAAGAA